MSHPAAARTLPSPHAVPAPEDAEGWEQMYGYYALFDPARRASDDGRCWVFDAIHYPEPIHPFDSILVDAVAIGLGQASGRIFCIPSAIGIDFRILNGYVYISANPVTDPEEIGRRAELFTARAGYYYQNWDRLYARWEQKVTEAIRALEALVVPVLPEVEDEGVVTRAEGVGSADALLIAWNRCLESVHTMWQYHFELLNLGYAAYLSFYQVCKESFPEIPQQAVTKMVSAIDVLLFRPDEELKGLAQAAIELGVASAFEGSPAPAEIVARLGASAAGAAWLAKLEAAKEPWFCFSHGNGFYHHHGSWIDEPSFAFAAIGDYVRRLEAGEDVARPLDALRRERDRVTAEYRALLPTDERRALFDEMLGLARAVFPYVEDHNFYVEHWYQTVFWNKVRAFGALLARGGFFGAADDIFFLRPPEVREALVDRALAWAAGSPARGPGHFPPIIARRKAILEALRRAAPPPALGAPPGPDAEPLTIMLWGINTEQIALWTEQGVRGSGAGEIAGIGGSPGVAEGRARVVMRPDALEAVEEGEILVCPSTSPSWTPLFARVKAAVSDIGGMMCHAAIVSREYGLPAVIGTGVGTRVIKTGQRIRVDGDRGVVTILE
jgi:pyruvate,water dikinase